MAKANMDKFTLASTSGKDYKLLALDFEQTFVKGHFHNCLMEMKISSAHKCNGVHATTLGKKINDQIIIKKPWATKELLNSLYSSEAVTIISERFLADSSFNIKNPNELKSTIRVCQAAGYKVAIVSYGLYPDAIIAACKKLNLDNITIITGFPAANNREGEYEPFDRIPNDLKGKQDHLLLAQIQCKMDDIIPDVVLVDDSEKNVNKAIASGAKGILVPAAADAPSTYLEKALAALGLSVPADFREPSSAEEHCIYITDPMIGEGLPAGSSTHF